MRQLLTIAHVVGGMLAVFALSFALPIGWSLAVEDGAHLAFVRVAGATLGIGLALLGVTHRFRGELQPRDGCLLVVACWALMAAVAAVPLMLAIPDLSFTDAYFECVSALTTSGATVLSGLETLAPSVNLWRHVLQWVGGMGIIVLAVAVLPLLGVGGMQLFKAETPGPMKEGKLAPRIAQVAKYLWLIYVGLTAACTLALRAAGMDWFDAICHAFSTVSLGGFSTRDASVKAFDSPAIEAVLALFMLIAVLNFTTHFTAWRRRSLGVYRQDSEALGSWALLLLSCVGLALYLVFTGTYPDYPSALRHGGFNVVSLGTSTGFMSDDYSRWPPFAAFWLLLLCAVSSSAGSPGGGIKMIRALILLKQAVRELVRLVHPRAVTPLTISGLSVDNRVITAVMGYMLLYGVTVLVLAFTLMATGLDPISAFTGVVASVNNTGPGLGELGPANNYAVLSDFQTWVMAVAMLAGRLELLTFFTLFIPSFWRK